MRIGRSAFDPEFVTQIGMFELVDVALTANVAFGHANTDTGPAGSLRTEQLFAGNSSPDTSTHVVITITSPACNVSPCVHVNVNFADLCAANATDFAVYAYCDAGTAFPLRVMLAFRVPAVMVRANTPSFTTVTVNGLVVFSPRTSPSR